MTFSAKLLEGFGLLIVLASWALGLWGVDKYDSEASSLSDDFRELTSYYQNTLSVLSLRLDLEVATVSSNSTAIKKHSLEERLQLQEWNGTAAFMLYEINDLNAKAWKSWFVRKKWLDVIVAKSDYVDGVYKLLDKYRIRNNIPLIPEFEEAYKTKKYVSDIRKAHMDADLTIQYGLPYISDSNLTHYQAMAIDRNLSIGGVLVGMMEGRRIMHTKLNDKKKLEWYLASFLLGSVLIITAKFLEHSEARKERAATLANESNNAINSDS